MLNSESSCVHDMGMSLCLVLPLVLGACGTDVTGAPDPDEGRPAITANVGAHVSDWSLPVDLGPDVNASNSEISPALSPDGLSLYFASARPGGLGGFDIWVSRRASPCDPLGTPVNLGPTINSAEREQGAFLSADGHLLFFMRGNALLTVGDIHVARRAHTDDDLGWEPPVPLGADVNTAELETEPWLVLPGDDAGGGYGTLYFGRGPNNNTQDFYSAPIGRDGRTLGPAVLVAELSSTGVAPIGNEDGITVRKDGREVIFASRRPFTEFADLFVAARQSPEAPWEPPQLVAGLNSTRPDLHPALSDDGRTLVFSSVRSGPSQFRLYMSQRSPGLGQGQGRCGAADE